jgi:hypothetical protein
MEEAGFSEVSVTRTPARLPFQLHRGVKQASPSVAVVVESPALVVEAEAVG